MAVLRNSMDVIFAQACGSTHNQSLQCLENPWISIVNLLMEIPIRYIPTNPIISHTFPIILHHYLLPNVVRKPHASESTIKKTKCPAGRHSNLHHSALDSQPVTLVSVVGGFKLPPQKKRRAGRIEYQLDFRN
jgi:hypothetical protein